MERYLTIYADSSVDCRNATRYLLRVLEKAGVIDIDRGFDGILDDRIIYHFTVNRAYADTMLNTFYMMDVIEYGELLDDEILQRLENKQFLTGDKHKQSRVGFAIIDGTVYWQTPMYQDMSTIDWMRDIFFVGAEEAEETVRGSIAKDKVRLYKGKEYNAPTASEISKEHLFTILRRCRREFGSSEARVELGAIPAEVGTEWQPREIMGDFSTF